jgi:hypothetical protein
MNKRKTKVSLWAMVGSLTLAFAVSDGYAATSGKSQLAAAQANVDESAVSGMAGGIAPMNGMTYGTLYGYTYRHDWGFRNGQWKLTLNWCAISPSSKVYVSISEADSVGNPFVGNARYTVHNVAPASCSVTTWVNVEWGSPIRLIANYTVLP